jgi:hypothetical protein
MGADALLAHASSTLGCAVHGTLGRRRVHAGAGLLPRAVRIVATPACAAAAAPASRPASSGRPWRSTPADQKYIVCNADEGDSGTFADRMIMEGDPFVLIEGMTIAGIAVGATKGYIYIRSEYPHAVAAMNEAIARARAGYLGEASCSARPPSTSKCGSAPAPMSAAKRPRCWKASKASAASCAPSRRCRRIKGLFGKPTVINNVLSLAAVPFILAARRQASTRLRHGPLARHHADPARRQHQARRPVEKAFGITLGEAGRRLSAAAPRPAGRCARCRSAARSAPISPRAVRHAVRLRGLRRARRADRPWRHRGVRRQRRHGQAGALRDGVLRHRILRQVHAVPHRLDARRRDHRQDRARRATAREPRRCSRPLRHHEIRLAVRAGRLHALPGDERAEAFPGRFRSGAATLQAAE